MAQRPSSTCTPLMPVGWAGLGSVVMPREWWSCNGGHGGRICDVSQPSPELRRLLFQPDDFHDRQSFNPTRAHSQPVLEPGRSPRPTPQVWTRKFLPRSLDLWEEVEVD